VATQIEAEKKGVEDARLKPLPDDGEELFRSLEILIIKLQLRKLEVEAEKEAHKADAEKEARKAESEARRLEAEKEARRGRDS